MEITTPMSGHSREVDGPSDEDWDQCEEEQEEESSAPDCDRKSESLADIYRDLLQDFPMPDAPLPESHSDSFGDFVAKEQARAKADGAPPPAELEEPLPVEPEATAGVELPRPDPAEMIAEAVQAAAGAKGVRPKKQGRKLNYVCKGYKTNDALANCRDINDKVRATLAIINGLMSDKGFCYCSDEQLAIWMHMSVRGAKNLLNNLARKGFIIHIGFSGTNAKRVVRPDLANNAARTQALIAEFTNIN